MESCETLSRCTTEAREDLEILHKMRDEHPIWNSKLLKGFANGIFTFEDCRYIFTQYYLYSKNFTRYLAGCLMNTENDYFRARLSENLWEEGGGADPESRHAQIFRNFLTNGLNLNINNLAFESYAQLYVDRYIAFCKQSDGLGSSSFLSLGTEGIVCKQYTMMSEGLKAAGIADQHLKFFYIHMECDDEHAATLENMMLSYADDLNWFQRAYDAMKYALDLRHKFFDDLYEGVRQQRIKNTIQRIDAREPLTNEGRNKFVMTDHGMHLYDNKNDKLNIEFSVTRIPFNAEVLDPRILKIPVGKNNENHKHAHETVHYIVKGQARTTIGNDVVESKAGDSLFIPRWKMHQTTNAGSEELVILAITDYNFSSKALMGSQQKSTRMKEKDADSVDTHVMRETLN